MASSTDSGTSAKKADVQDFETILEQYHLQFRFEAFWDAAQIPPRPPADWFLEELMFTLAHRGDDDKEAYICEFLIAPFLKQAWQRHPTVNLFSHAQIKTEELTLVPDYLVSKQTPTGFKRIYKPLLLTVEAKDEQFSAGWAKALLQTILCQKINGDLAIPIWAIVTTGDLWQFGKLDRQQFLRHPLPLSIDQPDMLFGVLDLLFAACEQQIM